MHVNNYNCIAYNYLTYSICEFTIMILNGFNIYNAALEKSNNEFYGFSSVKCTTSSILPVSQSTNRDIANPVFQQAALSLSL